MRRFVFFFSAVLVAVLDQITKSWCMSHLTGDVPEPWLDHFLYLTLTYNARGAFSLFPLPDRFFILIISCFLLVIFFHGMQARSGFFTQLLLGILAGGGMGNLLDRIRLGHVVDFLDLRWWPVFNLADSAITASVILLLIHHLLQPSGKGLSGETRKP